MVDPRSCVTCGTELPAQVRKGGVPKSYCSPCYDARRRERQRVKAPAEVAVPDDDQMVRLIRGYDAKPSLSVDKRPDGTRLMIISDTQLPFVDEPLLRAVLQFTADYQPNDIIYNGDILDCVTPDTRVLTYDLRWVRAGDLVEGQEIVGFDEESRGLNAGGRKTMRKMRRAVVEKLAFAPSPVTRLVMEDGSFVDSTPGHRWLGWKSTKNRAIPCWMTTDEIRERVRAGRPCIINRPVKPWDDEPRDYDAGFIEAAFDGEGSITFNKRSNNFGSLQFTQNPNPFMDAVEQAMERKGFSTSRAYTTDRPIARLMVTGGMWAFAQFIGRFRPQRFVDKWVGKAPMDGANLIGAHRARVIGATSQGEQNIIRIQTSSKTYLAEGFCAHNCYEISDFDKDPARQFGIKDEIGLADAMMQQFEARMAPKGKQYFVGGNHEDRLRRYIWRHAASISAIVPDLDKLLGLDKRCAGVVPYGKHVDYLGFTVTHGNYVSQFSAYTAKRHADRYHSSGCNGHTHRAGSYSYRDGRGKSHSWFEIGCLCRMDLEYVRGVANWQQAFLVGTVMNGALHPQLIRVIETDAGRGFFAGGKFYAIK